MVFTLRQNMSYFQLETHSRLCSLLSDEFICVTFKLKNTTFAYRDFRKTRLLNSECFLFELTYTLFGSDNPNTIMLIKDDVSTQC